MFNKTLLFLYFMQFLTKYNVTCGVEDNTHHRKQRSIFSPIENFFTSVRDFFGAKSAELQAKKAQIKNAFNMFIDELKGKKGKSEERAHYEFPKLRNYTWRSGYKKFFDRALMSAEHLIAAHGYKSESHTILTADGYMITMHRVLRDVEQRTNKVVMLHHGLLGSSEDWLLLGEKKALPYLLSENGYDVWLLNSRGNRYSRIHTKLNAGRLDFWDFSWHEIGMYDLPAAIKYISEITNKAELNFIGHSMGATAFLVLLSTLPEYNHILRSGILLAPLAFMYHAKGPISMLANFYTTNGHSSLNFLGQMELMASEPFPEQIVEKYCKGDDRSCLNPLLLLANGGSRVYSPQLMDNILAHVPAGGSVKTILHYVQLVKSGYFQMFDYGAADNVRRYKNETPSMYDLKHITLPIAIFSAPADWLATVSDIQTMLPLLQDVYLHHVVKVDNFGHYDFVWSPDAPVLVYSFILSLLNTILPKRDSFFDD